MKHNIYQLQLSDSNIILSIFIYAHLHREGRTKDSDLKCSKHSLNIICSNFLSYVAHYIMIQPSFQDTYLAKFTLQPSFIQTYFSSQKVQAYISLHSNISTWYVKITVILYTVLWLKSM
jgi:hypothetical protein